MEKIWIKHYQPGVPAEINPNAFTSLVDMFTHSCQTHQNRPAFVNMGSVLTYAQLDHISLQFATYLQQLGLNCGARVAIMMPNLLQYPVVLFAILRAGFIVVNTNPLYTCNEVAYQLKDAGAEAVIVLSHFAKTIEEALPQLPQLKHIIITEVGDLFPWIKRVVVNCVVRYVKKMIRPYHLPQATTLRDALKLGKSSSFQSLTITSDDTAFLQYTGGTTGISKGAILTHRNLVANVLQASSWISPLSIGENDIIITALPLYHVFSLTANCLTFMNTGAKNILITNPRDMTQFIKDIKHVQFTAITGVNTLFNSLLHHPDFHSIDFSKLKLSLSGGMALQKSVALNWYAQTRARVLEAYGLTETSPAVAINPMYLKEYNGSIGLPLPSTEVSIRDDYGVELSLGQQGELCVKGPQVMKGYWQRPEETDGVFWPDGFLRTGDIAVINDQGFIFLVDRKKDMILVSGFNVYPTEVEQVIGLMPGVLEVGVIGVDSGEAGEKIKACVVKTDPELTAEQIIAFTREHLTAYKIPKLVEFYSELPKSNIGKVLRRELR